MLTHCEAESLANDVIKGHREEVAAEQKQAEAEYAIEFAPLRLFFEYFVHLDGLSALSDLNRQCFLLPLDIQLRLHFFVVYGLDALQLQVIDPVEAFFCGVLLK